VKNQLKLIALLKNVQWLILLSLSLVCFAMPAHAEICNIKTFLDECPTTDPAIGKIKNDFAIRKDGVLVTNFQCQGPISQLTLTQYTDELIVLQSLRTIYYLDLGRSGHLPWTSGTMYDWLHDKVTGINIVSTGPDQCCFNSFGDGRMYFNVRANDNLNKDWKRTWVGISEFIGLMMHERRHQDGNGFPHTSCCSAGAGACDQQYDESNLSPYGIQWWLREKFVDGGLYTGYTCLSTQEVTDIKNFIRGTANQERTRFCQNQPPVLTEANNPPGQCNLLCGRKPGNWKLRWPWLPPWVPIIIIIGLIAAVLVYRNVRNTKR
jgi:hypothetical protein